MFGLAIGVALIAPVASAHIERASYWPDPGAQTVDGEVVGGDVPTTRGLFSALDAGAVGETRVVCMPTPSETPGGGPATPTVDSTPATANKKKKKKKKRKKKRKKKKQKRQFQATAEELATLEDHPSMQLLDASIAAARTQGYVVRPSEGPVFETVQGVPVSGAVWNEYLDDLRALNLQLLVQCNYNSIQAAVNDSGNNDRVVVMPGTYTEPESRAVPDFKSQTGPEWESNPCKNLVEENDTGSTGALSYRYQFHCPNHQNLIAVMGRAPDKDPNGDENDEEVPPFPAANDPRKDGIPDADGLANGVPHGGGNCIRCNLQLEGSGISPDDVVVDSGRVESGNGAPMESDKDVGIRVDRADGFVLRNMTVRHSEEHDIYSPETDGLRLERFKTYFNGHYGVLTFVADNHLIQDCDAAGSGDAAIYPGSSAEKGEQRTDTLATPFDADDQAHSHTMNDPDDPDAYSTEIRRCDMRHSNTGYSGTAGNSVWIHHNDFYDNAMGLVTDVFTASGHPGFPQDSDLIEDNEFYSNNFNPYVEDEAGELSVCDSANGEDPGPHGPNQGCTDVIPRIPAPVGTAMFLPGVNNNTIRDNHMWNNWRRGTMLFAVPDNFVCGNINPVAGGNQQYGCDETEFNTSHRNEQHDNVMGRSPDHAPDPTWPSGQDAEDPNDVDFWWDQGGTPGANNYKNCWYDNEGQEADGSGLDTLPAGPLLPGETTSVQSCATSQGAGSTFGQLQELLNCLGDYEFDTDTCNWFVTPAEPQPTP